MAGVDLDPKLAWLLKERPLVEVDTVNVWLDRLQRLSRWNQLARFWQQGEVVHHQLYGPNLAP
jgi:predicted SpoU family rRNA methylase